VNKDGLNLEQASSNYYRDLEYVDFVVRLFNGGVATRGIFESNWWRIRIWKDAVLVWCKILSVRLTDGCKLSENLKISSRSAEILNTRRMSPSSGLPSASYLENPGYSGYSCRSFLGLFLIILPSRHIAEYYKLHRLKYKYGMWPLHRLSRCYRYGTLPHDSMLSSYLILWYVDSFLGDARNTCTQ
jgi:hypothetical protein